MKILIVTPAAARSLKGNRITAERWARLLRQLGHRVQIEQEYRSHRCDLMVALHARRSFLSVQRFRRNHPDLPVLVALTGTDLYHDIRVSRRARQSLEMAARLIVLQPMGIQELPKHLRDKARVIYQSVSKPGLKPILGKRIFQVGVFGHLRPVKDPFRAAMAARLLPPSSRIRIVHAGAALSQAMQRRARAEQRRNARYHWFGELPRAKALALLARCRCIVLSSKMEGGANVLSEAIVSGVPALVSRVSGNVGMLGLGYPGYFTFGKTGDLAALLERCERQPAFLKTLETCYRPLRYQFRPDHERKTWKNVLDELAVPKIHQRSRRWKQFSGLPSSTMKPERTRTNLRGR
jgi:putative glycosyltransferase (TIGR04348 family)